MRPAFEVLAAHNIRYFFCVGGNDSRDTAHKIHPEALNGAYALRVMGVLRRSTTTFPQRITPAG